MKFVKFNITINITITFTGIMGGILAMIGVYTNNMVLTSIGAGVMLGRKTKLFNN